MKKFGFLALCAVMSISIFAQKPEVTTEKTVHDFGKVKEEAGNANCTFVIKNTGDAPLVISRVTASCGCTTPDWTKEPIAAGASGTIKVTYGAKGRPGPFEKTISVYTNARQAPYILTIKGEVIPQGQTTEAAYPSEMGDLRLKKVYASFNAIKNTETRVDNIEVYNQGLTALRVSFSGMPAYVTAVCTPAIIPPGGTANIAVTYNASKVNDFGTVNGKFNVILNEAKSTNQYIFIQSTITQDFSKLTAAERDNAPIINVEPTSLNFNIKTEKSKTLTIKNTGKTPLILYKVKPTSDAFTAAPAGKKTIQPGKSLNITVSVKTTQAAATYLEIPTNDPKSPLKMIRLSASVEY